MSLHAIDKNGNYSDVELEKLMVFCLLDRANLYKTVCKTFDELDSRGYTTRDGLKNVDSSEVEKVVKLGGHRFPKQMATVLKRFAYNNIDLKTATRDELTEKIDGIGPKLASMYLRNTRGYNYAVIDVHIINWLKEEYGFIHKNYFETEKFFKQKALELNMTTYDLDMKVWQERRRGNKN